MNLFEVDRETCNQDGICAAVCPLAIIDFQKGGYPTPTEDAAELCIRCGHCVAVCPTGSLSHRDMAVAACPPMQKDFHLSAAQCEQFLRSRRSIRVYRNQPVSRDDLARLIEMAGYAPTGHNSQPVKWLVLTGRDELRRIAGIVVDWMRWMIDNVPDVASMLHMDRTVRRFEAGSDVILRGAPAVIVAHAEKDNRTAPTSCTIAMTWLELAATSLGLGGCWAGYFTAAAEGFPPMVKALSLPKHHRCFGAMMVGHPKFKYHRLPLRKTPDIIWR